MHRRDFVKLAALVALLPGELAGCFGIGEEQGVSRAPAVVASAEAAEPAKPLPAMAVAYGKGAGALLDTGLAAMGGLKRFVSRGARVVIKANFSMPREPKVAANTDPQLVAELVRRCLKAGASTVTVVDHPASNSAICLQLTGIRKAVEAVGGKVRTLDQLTREDYVKVTLKGPTLTSAYYSRAALEADLLINFPILKHHASTKVTIGLKNLMGLVWDRQVMHRTDLERTIAELAAFKQPHLTVLDATRGLVDHGPMGPGTVKEWNRVVFSTRMLELDAYGAQLFGLKPAQVDHLRIAAELGVGTLDWAALKPVWARVPEPVAKG